MSSSALTVFNSMCVSVALMGLCLAIGVGLRPSGLRSWIASLLWQAAGWGLLSASIWAPEHAKPLTILGTCALVVSVSCMYLTASHYLCRRPLSTLVYGPPMSALVLSCTPIWDETLRMGMINITIGAQTAWMTWILVPKHREERSARWRWLALFAYAFITLGILFSIVFNAFAPGQTRPSNAMQESRTWFDDVALAINSGWPMICTLGFLLAHRDEAERALHRLAAHDGLTGLLNRRTLMERADEALALARRNGQALAVLMLDIDHFKKINDAHGHQVGDTVLATFAKVLTACLRTGDVVGRYGGEEFCVLLHMANVEEACAVDRRVREQLSSSSVEMHGLEISFSAGLACTAHPFDETLTELIGRSDRALYQAKSDGRARLVADLKESASTFARVGHSTVRSSQTV